MKILSNNIFFYLKNEKHVNFKIQNYFCLLFREFNIANDFIEIRLS